MAIKSPHPNKKDSLRMQGVFFDGFLSDDWSSLDKKMLLHVKIYHKRKPNYT